MTRKRFIKLLMSKGYSRNEAVDYVNTSRSPGLSYCSMYVNWIIERNAPIVHASFSEMLEAVAKAICNINWSALAEAITSFEE